LTSLRQIEYIQDLEGSAVPYILGNTASQTVISYITAISRRNHVK